MTALYSWGLMPRVGFELLISGLLNTAITIRATAPPYKAGLSSSEFGQSEPSIHNAYPTQGHGKPTACPRGLKTREHTGQGANPPQNLEMPALTSLETSTTRLSSLLSPSLS